MRPLTNPIRRYAWGSRTALASLQRRPAPTPEPEAELWMGAHPTAPSLLSDEDGSVPLTEAIDADPSAALGEAVADQFGGRLPYLFKILAAAQPLSLQAHPDSEQARVGFAAEEAAGLARTASVRNYADPYHKPELLVAIEEFHALCGFRGPDATAALLGSFGVPALKPVIAALEAGPVSTRLRSAVETLMRWPVDDRMGLVAAVAEAGRSFSSRGESYALAADLGQRYPGDVGVVVALLLNQVRLRPDEAVFMPAGNLHAYLAGVGVEVMAASDNVIRGGLTPKHVDVSELLRVLRYEVMSDPVLRAMPVSPGVVTWAAPVREFSLVKAVADAAAGPVSVPGAGPRILVCVQGAARLSVGTQVRRVTSGESVFVAATEPSVEVSGDAVIFQVAPG